MSTAKWSNDLNGYLTTRRTLLKTAAMGAAAGVAAPWMTRTAGANPASLPTRLDQTERGE
jgi:hypothetical protein